MYTEVHLFMPAPFQRPKLNLLAVPIDFARKEHKQRNRAKDAEQKKREYISPNLRCFQVIQKKNQDKNLGSSNEFLMLRSPVLQRQILHLK